MIGHSSTPYVNQRVPYATYTSHRGFNGVGNIYATNLQTNTVEQMLLPKNEKLTEIENLDLERLRYKLLKDQPQRGWGGEKFDIALTEYKRFLILKVLHPEKSFAPTSLMDEIWHLHILDTKAYMRDCKSIFNKYFHHAPSFGQYNSEEQNSRLVNSRRNLEELYPEHFGEPPYGLETLCGHCGDSTEHPDDDDDDDG